MVLSKQRKMIIKAKILETQGQDWSKRKLRALLTSLKKLKLKGKYSILMIMINKGISRIIMSWINWDNKHRFQHTSRQLYHLKISWNRNLAVVA